MKILFLVAEATPFVKIGGLADVAGELPSMLRSLDVKVRVVLPFHSPLHQKDLDIEHLLDVKLKHAHGQEVARFYRAKRGKNRVYLVDGYPVRTTDEVYGEVSLDAHKFTFAFFAAMEAMKDLNWQPDLLHAHDWHAAPAVAWLSELRKAHSFWTPVASLLTIHNLPYMGAGGESTMEFYGIPPSAHPNLPYWARHVPLPLGLASADWINTVSPSYAREIQRGAIDHGLEELLRCRSDRLVGILNGIDIERWNPETDQALPVNYSRKTLTFRREVKLHLLERLALKSDLCMPLIGVVSRLDNQKGIDVGLAALDRIANDPWQFVLLGSGDSILANRAGVFAQNHSNRARVILRFDAQLARLIYAGADILLIPSRYEPCGLTQMIAMRYGCVPVVSAIGGLKDTVSNYMSDGSGTGFVFHPLEPKTLAQTLRRAISVYADQRRWRGLQLRGMAKDCSWEQSARKYLQLYQKAITERRSFH
jgi:starch synthase